MLQIPHTNLKSFGERVFCAYAPHLWNELPDNVKAADSVQNFKTQQKTISKGGYLTICTINICDMSTDYSSYSAFEHYRCQGCYIKYQLLLLLYVIMLSTLWRPAI